MSVIGRYVSRFSEANYGMLEGVSLNAPYAFHWLHVQGVEGTTLLCTGAGKPMRLPIRQTRRGERATVTVQDPIFGPTDFEVHPFAGSNT